MKAKRYAEKAILGPFVGLTMVALLVSCSSDSGQSDEKTLRVQTLTGQTYEAMAAAAKDFEASHPGVKVKLETISDEAKTGSNLTVLTGSNPPDIGYVPFTTPVYARLLENDKMVPLEDVWASSDLEARYGPGVTSALTSNGTQYSVDIALAYYNLVFINRDAFEKAGIDPPADRVVGSYDALVTMVSALKGAGYQGLAIGPTDGYQSSWLIDALLPTAATPEELENLNTNYNPNVDAVASYTDDAMLETLEGISAMGDDQLFQDGYLGQGVAKAEALFSQGKAGMLLDGSWTPAALTESGLSFELDWILLPPIDPSKPTKINSFFGDTLVIPTGASNQDLAKEYLELLVTDDVQLNYFLNDNGLLPAVNTVDLRDAKLDPVTTSIIEYAATESHTPGWTSVVPGEVSFSFVEPLLQKMWLGQLTPDQVATMLQENLETYREKAAS